MGVDSGGWILAALDDPQIRSRLAAVMIAQTGWEWPDTKEFMEKVVFPKLRKYNILTIQAARKGPLKEHGIVILDRTRQPEVCYTRSTKAMPYFTLAHEMAAGGTFPATAGGKKCSQRSKGAVLDPVRAELMGNTSYLHGIFYDRNEGRRAAKDSGHNTALRTGWYPLIEDDLDREDCQKIIKGECGEVGSKSACTFCCFALTSKAGRAMTVERFRLMPEEALIPIILEEVGVRLNPAMGGLAGGERLLDILHDADDTDHVLHPVMAKIDRCTWAVYRVQRVITGPGRAMRRVQLLDGGTRAEMERQVHGQAKLGRGVLEQNGDITRLWTQRRGTGYPTRERFLVTAPGLAKSKERSGFEQAWWRAA
jgi:hypothetical protein